MLAYLSILFGFIFLIKGADFLVDGASAIAKRLKVSDLVIGLTIVAFGTSSPELVVNILASFRNSADIAIGNILGSNIVNILFILGLSAVIYPLTVTRGTVWKEIPLCFLAVVVLGLMANDKLIDNNNFSSLTRIDGLILLSFFLIFMYYAFGIAKNRNNNDKNPEALPAKGPQGPVAKNLPAPLDNKPYTELVLVQGKHLTGHGATLSSHAKMGLAKPTALVIIGLIALFAGGNLIVDGAVKVALMLGVSELLIGLTIVAIGTSLPELVTSIVAALKKNPDIVVGNIIGSNIFNIFFVLGISAVINPLPFQENTNPDIIFAIAATFLLFIVMFIGKKHILERWQGVSFIVLYIAYIVFLITRG